MDSDDVENYLVEEGIGFRDETGNFTWDSPVTSGEEFETYDSAVGDYPNERDKEDILEMARRHGLNPPENPTADQFETVSDRLFRGLRRRLINGEPTIDWVDPDKT